jgi:hypothetical protein
VRSEELPKTPTGKIRKAALREDGVGSAWDRGETRKPAPQPTACEATNSLRRKP